MLGNIWLSSALIVTAIFSASAMYKSYSDIQEAKQIKEHYEIVSDIKTLLAKQYNKNPQDITRDEIIAYLPVGGNWEKVLLIDRNKDSKFSDEDKNLVNKDGNFKISEDEKLKLLALKSKLKNIIDVNSVASDPVSKNYVFKVGEIEKNLILKDKELEKNLKKAIHFLSEDILYTTGTVNIKEVIEKTIEEFTPYESMYQDFEKIGEGNISVSELEKRKRDYFKLKIKEKLSQNETAMEARLYSKIRDKL